MINGQNGKRIVRVGSRTSALALKQTNMVMDMLLQKHCDIEFELITMDTIGDLILDKALSKIGDKSLFTKELELALEKKAVDFVVHSLKDVPTALSSQFVLACVCSREVCEDAVVMRAGSPYKRLIDLPTGSVIGTSSVRRVAQLTHKYPNLSFASVRGNLNTRLKKLDCSTEDSSLTTENRFEAIILARAGLERLGWHSRMSEVLDDEDCLYAVGQGALACECRCDDPITLRLLSSIHDEKAALTSLCERSLMRNLDGGCSTPIAVRSCLSSSNVLRLSALVMSVDGSERIEDSLETVLPEEDLDTILERISPSLLTTTTNNNSSSSTNNNLCIALTRRINRKRSYIDRIETSEQEIMIARDQDSLFSGMRVFPICEIGRLRMAVSQRLGALLADRLLNAGAKTILDNIKRTEGELTILRKPTKENIFSD